MAHFLGMCLSLLCWLSRLICFSFVEVQIHFSASNDAASKSSSVIVLIPVVIFFKRGKLRPLLRLFSFLSQYNDNFKQNEKAYICAWDSNSGTQDGRRTQCYGGPPMSGHLINALQL